MMKKTAVFLAVSAALVTPAMAAEFEVNKDTKFQVNVEVAGYHVDQKSSAGVSQKDFSGKGLNQIEIKADHVVSPDVTVFGEIEVDYDPIGDNGALATDDVRLGINSKSMGRFSFGQFDSYFEDNVIEALQVAHGENGNVTEAGSDNDGRRVQWTKSFGAFTLAVEGSFATNKENKAQSNTAMGVTGLYKLGDLTLALGHSKINKFKSDLSGTNDGTPNTNKATTAATASYKLGDLTLIGLVAKTDKLSAGKIDIMGAGLKYKMGEFDIGFAAQNFEETGKDKRTEVSLGLGYTPFKNTVVYVDMRKLDKVKNEGNVVEIGMKYAF